MYIHVHAYTHTQVYIYQSSAKKSQKDILLDIKYKVLLVNTSFSWLGISTAMGKIA